MNRPAVCFIGALLLANSAPVASVLADPVAKSDGQRSITDRSAALPSWNRWRRVLLLKDYNTRVVILGATLLGCAAGMVGSFTLLRKRELMGDALSHAALPGICLAPSWRRSSGGTANPCRFSCWGPR